MKPSNFHNSAKFLLLLPAAALLGCGEPAEQEAAAPSAPGSAGTAAIIGGMLENLGGLEALRAVDVMVLEGSGTRRHLGQIPETGGEDPEGQLTELTEIIDLENGRAAFDNVIVIGGGFQQRRTEALTRYQGELLSWGTTEGRPNQVTSVDGIFSWATHNSPEWLLRRNVVTMALAAADSPAASDATPPEPPSGPEADQIFWRVPIDLDGEEATLLIDPDSNQLAGWETLDTETMVGDTQATYLWEDYRQVNGLNLPFALEILKEDGVYASIQYQDIRINDESALAVFEIPGEVAGQADAVVAADGSWVPLSWNPITGDVTHVQAFSHHSMVVEFPDYAMVIEAPYSQGQSLALARLVEENIGKPIRYVAPTHPHYDHTGGIRAMVSLGATAVVAEGHEEELRMIIESPHSNPPDALAERLAEGAEVGRIEVFAGMTTIGDAGKTVELYEVSGIPHVEPKVLAFVPEDGVLFQSDLFFGGPGPDAEALYMAIQELGLEVDQIAGGHGGVLPFSALQEAVASGN